MPRPPHPSRAPALIDLRNGDSIAVVAERYNVKQGTVRNWRRSIGEIAPQPTNVVPLKSSVPTRRLPGGRTKDEKKRAEKLRAYHERENRARNEARVAALGPVDRASVRRIIRRQVQIQETGMWCPTCPPDAHNRADDSEVNTLSPRDLLAMTRALHLNLERLGPLLEAEGRLSESETVERGADYYQSPEGMAELADSIKQIGPRTLAAVLASDDQAMRVVMAAVQEANRSVG